MVGPLVSRARTIEPEENEEVLYDFAGGAVDLNTSTAGWQEDPSIARLAGGGAVVVWTDRNGGGGDSDSYAVKAQLLDPDGNKIGAEFLVNATTAGAQYRPHVTPLADGGFAVAYYSGGDILVRLFDGAGDPVGTEWQANTTAETAREARVVELDTGDLLVTWVDIIRYGTFSGYSDLRVWGQVYERDGTAVGSPVEIDTGAGEDTGAENPAVAALAGGGFVVAWDRENDFDRYVRLQLFDSEGSLLRTAVVNSGTDHNRAPAVAALEDGGFLLVWGTDLGIRSQTFDADGTARSSVVTISTGKYATEPSVVALSDGSFLLLWELPESEGSSNHDVHGRFLNADGSVGSEAFLVAENASRDELDAGLVELGSGKLALVWGDAQGDGDMGGIKLRLIEPVGGEVTDLSLSATSISETAVENSAAALLDAEGVLNSRFTYTIVEDTSGGAFAIAGDRLIVSDNALLDHETAPEVTLTVRATDQSGNSREETFVLSVTDSADESRWREGDERLVNTSTSSDEHDSAAAGLVGGGHVVVWTDRSGSRSDVFGQLYDADGNALGSHFRITLSSGGVNRHADVIALDDGGFIVTWNSESLPTAVLGQRYDASGSKVGDDFQINTSASPAYTIPDAASLADGGFVVVWKSSTDGNPAVHGQRFDADGAAVGDEFVAAQSPLAVDDPRVVGLPDGGFLVLWGPYDQDGSGYGIYARRYDAEGAPAGAEFLVNTTTEGSQYSGEVAVLAGGGFVVTWNDGGSSLVNAKIYDADGAVITDEFAVADASNGTVYNPVVAALPDGGFLVSWNTRLSSGGTIDGEIFARRFDAQGTPLGEAFVVNSTTGDLQEAPAVSTLADGGFVVTWTSQNQDGSEGGVYSKTFRPASVAIPQPDDFATDEASPVAGNLFADNGSGPDSTQAGALEVASVGGAADAVGREIVLASGALLTVRADGTFDYDPNGAFDWLTGPGSGAANTSAADTFTYSLSDGSTATATVTVTGIVSAGDRLEGSGGDDEIAGSDSGRLFVLDQGGDDNATGGAGEDGFYFGGALTGADTADGGGGEDQLGLQGDYAGFTFGAGNLVRIEMLVLLSGSDSRFGDPGGNLYGYDLTTVDENVGAGERLVVSFNTLLAGENVTFDGSAETDGSFLTYGGLGADVIIGGQQDDGFYFGADGRWGGDDRVDGQAGAMDQLGLQGNYSGADAILFGPGQLAGIEMLVLLSGGDTRFGSGGEPYSYDVTMDDANVAAGEALVVKANSLLVDELLIFDGSAETDGAFTVYGGAGGDSLTGGAGDDELWGRGGADLLAGGDGADRFVYGAAGESTSAARDTILDFAAGDLIDLSRIDAIAGGEDDGFTFVGSAAFSNTAGELRAEQSGAKWLVEADLDGDGAADVAMLVTRTDSQAIVAADFVL